MKKRIFSIIIVFLLVFSSYGAVVSDNDGAAFITKSEFDSLKSNFQSQIDQYNNSIDSKIDDAIVSYLKGIVIKAGKQQRNVLCYDENGILCVRGRADQAWSEGHMKWSGRLEKTHMNGTKAGWVKYTFPGGTATTFKSLGLTMQDKTNGYALWSGYIDNLQELQIFSDAEKSGSLTWSGGTRSIQIFSWPSISGVESIDWNTIDTKTLSAKWASYDCSANLLNLIPTRQITKTSNPNIIIGTGSISESRFEIVDKVMDFCNDSDTSGHTNNTDQSLCAGSPVTVSYKKTSAAAAYTATLTWATGTGAYYPYIGFTKYITNYNQLATSQYDSIISSILSYYPSTAVYTDETGIKHLFIGAGVPIIELKKGDKIELPIKFKDTSLNYDIYLKMGPFTRNLSASAESGCIKANEVGLTTGDYTYAIRIKNGQGTVKFTASQDGILFMKWTLAGNSCAGGGVYLPINEVEIDSAE